jgi:hypothetical protein
MKRPCMFTLHNYNMTRFLNLFLPTRDFKVFHVSLYIVLPPFQKYRCLRYLLVPGCVMSRSRTGRIYTQDGLLRSYFRAVNYLGEHIAGGRISFSTSFLYLDIRLSNILRERNSGELIRPWMQYMQIY